MGNFKAYQHVCRLGTEETEGILQNSVVYVTPKLDGTNSSIWMENGEICCGSRTRELSAEKDNAGFYAWVHSDHEEMKYIKQFFNTFPNLRLYGEYTGTSKFVGNIKDYDSSALGMFHIFDVFSDEEKSYLDDGYWRNLLNIFNLGNYYVPILAVLNNPVVEDIENIAKENKYLLTNANHAGEGVVIRALGWRNKYGRQQYAKLVLDEYKQSKKEKKKTAAIENVEEWIIDNYLTDAEISKNMAKAAMQFNADEFDNCDGRMIGYLLNISWNESVLEEAKNWLKKLRNPVVDFAKLKNLCENKVRKYARIGY